jgi:hypothetical protein
MPNWIKSMKKKNEQVFVDKRDNIDLKCFSEQQKLAFSIVQHK